MDKNDEKELSLEELPWKVLLQGVKWASPEVLESLEETEREFHPERYQR